MKILWLTNAPITIINKEVFKSDFSAGGWLDGMSDGLLKQNNVDFVDVFPYKTKVNQNGGFENVSYYVFPSLKDENQQQYFEEILKKEQPCIIHIFGTEFKHSLNMIKVCEKLNLLDRTIINIQGLCSVIAKHYFADLPQSVIHNYTFRDFVKHDNIYLQKMKFKKRGQNEIQTLQIAKNVIGRTDWDGACTLQINPNLNYYFCNETLRNQFYQKKWDYDKCEKFSIFVSQSNYPIKGFHKLLNAMPLILNQFPKAKIYTTGKDLLNLSFKDRLKLNSYQKHLINLIKKFKLENKVYFCGKLNEVKMRDQYLKSNVFVSCSSIENSPNSVGEAMLLGVPTISSDVGGVKNLIEHNQEGFIYPFDEEYMLAYYICELFKNKVLAEKFSKNARKHALKTHDKETNFNQLMNIYNKLKG